MQENEMKTFVQDRQSILQKEESSTSFVLEPLPNVSPDDALRKTTGFQMDFLLENADGALDKRFRETLSSLSPQNWSIAMVEKWQERLESYVTEEEDDLNSDEWEALGESLQKFYNDVLKSFGDNVGDGLHSTQPESYASNAIEAIKLLKRIKWKVSDAFDEIYFDDSETEVKRILNKMVDIAVLSVEGGRPFERTEIDWVDPTVDQEFNKQLYSFASANQTLPDAQAIPWLPSARQDAAILLPSDLLERLTTPLKMDDVDDHEDWEYSVTHPSDEEKCYTQFEGIYEQIRKNLKDVLTDEIEKYSNKVDTTASIDPSIVEIAAKRLEAGEIDVDFKSMFILPYDTNHCKLIGVRDDNVGDMITYKEVLKPPSERIVDQKLRNDPSAWFDPERPAGPRVRTFGWEPLADLEEDLPKDETEMVKKKENPDVLAAGSELSIVTKERAEKLVQTLKEKCSKVIEEKKYSTEIANPSVKDYLNRKGQRFGIIPDNFDSPEDFLETLDMPKLREKDAGKAFPLDNEVIPLEPDWLGLDGNGPHEELTEELYWKQLQSFKKPLSVPSVDWKALLNQDVLEYVGAESEELKRYLSEVTEPQLKKAQEAEPPEPNDSLKVEKDTPARKRALDKEFVREWVDKFGNDEGIQGLDPKNFKPSEHLVSSEEYDEKFLTHPYTSSYVFHPNFVRFRRMTRNHPTFSEYTFKKLESASTLNSEDNVKEFKSILSDLDENGPQIALDDIQQLNEKNLGVEAEEAKKWDLEFSTYMTEGLSLLESFAEPSRSTHNKPDKPCKEETSDDLLFGKVEKHELPDFLKNFRLQPFTLEDYGNLPVVGSGKNDVVSEKNVKKSKTPASECDSDSEESDNEQEVTEEDVSWRPFKEFKEYKNVNVLQLLSDASQLIETSVPKHFHPSSKVVDWINGKYQPSTGKLKKWRKLYGSLFPKVDSLLKTPYLFLSEEEKLNRLRIHVEEDPQDPDNPWTLTEEEKIALKNSANKPDEVDEGHDDDKEEKLSRLEEMSGISVRLHRNVQEWAEELDTSEAPDMSVLGTPAMEFMFKLDNFQKQAIMALEKGYNVFVSAHTSAGKTVVAEYAIAMSRKRRSRAIYTSPIKALSNQKYKDFKKCFESVGLITGDVQLNETADCLIMTTEILRSMLYNASEGIRDLEFVVLDEVHYMNDRERGHVWEEVLILLPANVQIVMLSATVPNTMEFASWVGRNKERKTNTKLEEKKKKLVSQRHTLYNLVRSTSVGRGPLKEFTISYVLARNLLVMVCKTQHRPVPLKHYFYVDVNGKNPAQGHFLLRDGDGPVLKNEWQEIRKFIQELERVTREERKAVLRRLDEKRALEGKKFKEQHHQDGEDPTKSFGSGPNRQEMMKFYNKKERAQWGKFIKYLKDIEWLPTIVFAFSRKKCDELAELLNDLDLTTPLEKLCIKAFIKSQVAKLDEEDRNLPQIRTLGRHLVRGIGVHHSGILPVLKEIVEFLFQEGKVKLLFATETFAMGVNMPARTVVFYSIKKFDGGEQRFLLPAEYIQMAGRAGRRGEDTVGNVIIRCPSRDAGALTIETIEAMMTGSPRTLTSQFRVSYRMILGTLTARSHITAENMMKQSYHENNEQKKYFQLEDALRIAKDLESKQRTVIYSRYQKNYIDRFCQIYEDIDEYLKMWSQLREVESEQTKFLKEVQVGKLVKFRCGPVPGAVGVITKITAKPLEFLVMSLRNFDRSAILEQHPEMKDSNRWFIFLSMFPLPKQRAGGELDMRLLFYKIKVDDILEVYKDNVNVTEENAPHLIRNAQLANIGGRLTGLMSENGTIPSHPIGCPQVPNFMPYPYPLNATPQYTNPGNQLTNLPVNSAFSNSLKSSNPNQINYTYSNHNAFTSRNSARSCNFPSPGNVVCSPTQVLPNVLQGLSINVARNNFIPHDTSERLTPGNPLSNNPLSFEFAPTNAHSSPNPNLSIPDGLSPGCGNFGMSWAAQAPLQHRSGMHVAQQFSNPLVGQPLMYSAVRPSPSSSFLPSHMHRPEFSVQNRSPQFGNNGMWYNGSENNTNAWPGLAPGVPHVPQTNYPPANNASYMVYPMHTSNFQNRDKTAQSQSWQTPFQQIHHHPVIRTIKPNLQRVPPIPSLKEACRNITLENEAEFPKLGLEHVRDMKNKPTSELQKPSASAVLETSNISLTRSKVHHNEGTEHGIVTNFLSVEPNNKHGSKRYVKMSVNPKSQLQGNSWNTSLDTAVDELKVLASKLDSGVGRTMGSSSDSKSKSDDAVDVGQLGQHFSRLCGTPCDLAPQLVPPVNSNPICMLTQSAGLLSPNPIQSPGLSRQHLSRVSGNPHDFLPQRSQPPQSYCQPNHMTSHPVMFPQSYGPFNHWLHPQVPQNCYPALVLGPRNTTKSDGELEHICYKLHSPGLKPVDEMSLARESESGFELYQYVKIREEAVAASIGEFYAEQTREDFIEAFAKIFKWMETVRGKDQLQKEVAEKTMTLYPEYSNKMEILKTMNYVVEDSVQMKGYMAARISKYELVITEMLVRNVIKDLTPEEVAGLMSFIVYQARASSNQNDDNAEKVPIADGLPNLQQAIGNTKAIILEIMNEENDWGVYSEELTGLLESFELTDIMYQWAKQKSFSKVISMAKGFQEGMLVRWIQQLVEALKEIESAARVMGDPAVPEKIQASIKSIKRGIVFSPSLYTTL